jgi:hypothetical protein
MRALRRALSDLRRRRRAVPASSEAPGCVMARETAAEILRKLEREERRVRDLSRENTRLRKMLTDNGVAI